MTLNELMLGNIQSNRNFAAIQPGTQNSQNQTAGKSAGRNERSGFDDIIDRRMNSTNSQDNVRRSVTKGTADGKNAEMLERNSDKKPKYLSFREANERNVKSSALNTAAGRKADSTKLENSQPDKVEDDSRNKNVQDQVPNNLLHIFAQVLGLDIGDLQKLLKEAGITSESFNNMNNISENVSRLSQLLGLDNKQESTLVTMLQLAGEVMDSASMVQQEPDVQDMPDQNMKSVNSNLETIQLQSAETKGNQETSPATSVVETLAEKLNLQIKSKLNELGKKLETDQRTVEEELKQLLLPLMDKAAMKLQKPLQQDAAAIEAGIPEQPTTIAVAGAEAASAEDDGARQESNTKTEKGAALPQPTPATGEVQTQAAFAVVPPEKMNGADAIKETALKTPVAQKEIISQVIEKAKVVLTPDKSEMVMDLKPDSLGRISLKVVTENGMVMAKFIADSQQVKQVLESNMQLLKDSLEKQGMSVQGFSVSVRQDSNRSAEKWTKPETGRNRSFTGTAYRTAGIEGSLTGVTESAGRSNPYNWGGSTINLTA